MDLILNLPIEITHRHSILIYCILKKYKIIQGRLLEVNYSGYCSVEC